ncbi:MAG TPA: NTP transferase domain-containing protein [Mycobacteriales bacterium]|nr:NTP transferase domain-containing protein [Mycobacteriales bacterium]
MSAPLPAYDGLVLAGGRARRMAGIDKPALVVGGRRLLDVALEALEEAANRFVVAGTADLPPGVVLVSEDPPGGGPVAAIAAGLARVTAPICVVLAADLPFVARAHVEQLVAAVAGSAALAVDADGRDQPLLAAYDSAALRRALPPAPQGASMRELLAVLGDPRRVTLSGDPAPWLDCDTGEDLDRARALQDGA